MFYPLRRPHHRGHSIRLETARRLIVDECLQVGGILDLGTFVVAAGMAGEDLSAVDDAHGCERREHHCNVDGGSPLMITPPTAAGDPLVPPYEARRALGLNWDTPGFCSS